LRRIRPRERVVDSHESVGDELLDLHGRAPTLQGGDVRRWMLATGCRTPQQARVSRGILIELRALAPPEEEAAAAQEQDHDDDDQQRLVVHPNTVLPVATRWLFRMGQSPRRADWRAKT
jgi:hypothetical protein